MREIRFFLGCFLIIFSDKTLNLLQDFLLIEGLALFLLLNDLDDLVQL